jgi:2-polyprenyl-3-methyl-5-hydroxy-6-metoxy-1,4-benzoquinol methylase
MVVPKKTDALRINVEQAVEGALAQSPFQSGFDSGDRRLSPLFKIAMTVSRYLSPVSRILDFACGNCVKSAVLQRLGYMCHGYDDLMEPWHKANKNRERVIAFALRCGIEFTLAEAGEPLPYNWQSFDMVMVNDFIEHLHDSPRFLLIELLELVKPGGLLFLTIPSAVNIRKRVQVLIGKTNMPRFESYYWDPPPYRGHIREYVKDDMRKLARFLDLQVLELRGVDLMLHRVPRGMRPIYMGITNVFKGFKDSWLLVARKPENWKPVDNYKEYFEAVQRGKNRE